MTSGRIYEVFVGGKPVGLVGSTTRTLEQRRKSGYTKRFGPGVELHLIREIPHPVGYSDSDFNFYLKACEAMDIARGRTYMADGGLNKVSPLIQALGHPMLEIEMGKIGGRTSGRKAVETGRLAKMRELPQTKVAQQKVGRQHIESGHLARIRELPQAKDARRRFAQNLGRKAVESGQLARVRELPQTKAAQRDAGRKNGHNNIGTGLLVRLQTSGKCTEGGRRGGRRNAENGNLVTALCKRWNINRGKACTCGKH